MPEYRAGRRRKNYAQGPAGREDRVPAVPAAAHIPIPAPVADAVAVADAAVRRSAWAGGPPGEPALRALPSVPDRPRRAAAGASCDVSPGALPPADRRAWR